MVSTSRRDALRTRLRSLGCGRLLRCSVKDGLATVKPCTCRGSSRPVSCTQAELQSVLIAPIIQQSRQNRPYHGHNSPATPHLELSQQ